jgi:CBS domain-containing protein
VLATDACHGPRADTPQETATIEERTLVRAATIAGFCSHKDVIAAPAEALAIAASRMRFNDVGCVPVIDGGRLTGILTERDLARAIADGIDPREVAVADYMTPEPIVVDSDATVVEASRVMVDAGIRHLPVLENGQVVGVLSMRDILAELLWSKVLTPLDRPEAPR